MYFRWNYFLSFFLFILIFDPALLSGCLRLASHITMNPPKTHYCWYGRYLHRWEFHPLSIAPLAVRTHRTKKADKDLLSKPCQLICMREKGLEPSRTFVHMNLNHARLPIPAFPQLTNHILSWISQNVNAGFQIFSIFSDFSFFSYLANTQTQIHKPDKKACKFIGFL